MSQTADSEPDPADLTLLLRRGGQGDAESEGRFVALVYNEMRKMARKHMRSESLGGTLQTTALVREAYLRLFQRPIDWQDRSHFFAVASHTMRRVLVDYARARQATKRSGGTADEAVKGGVGGGPVFRQHQVLRHAAGDSFSTPGPAGNTRSGADRGRAPAACGCRHRWNRR